MWPWSTIRKLRDKVDWQRDIISAQGRAQHDSAREINFLTSSLGDARIELDALRLEVDRAKRSLTDLAEIAGKNAEERDAAQASALALSKENERLRGLRQQAQDDFVRVQEQLLVAMKNDRRGKNGRFVKAGT